MEFMYVYLGVTLTTWFIIILALCLGFHGLGKGNQKRHEELIRKQEEAQRLWFQLQAIQYLKIWIEIMKESEEKEIGLQWLITKEKTSLIIEWRLNQGRALCEKFQFHQYSNTWEIEDEEMALKDWQLFLSELS